jgi:hypothetical protein
MTENWLKCCRYCRHFGAGECCHPDLKQIGGSNLENIIDDGLIGATIEETLDDISESKLDAVETAVIQVLRNNLELESPFKINDPGVFCCKYWD